MQGPRVATNVVTTCRHWAWVLVCTGVAAADASCWIAQAIDTKQSSLDTCGGGGGGFCRRRAGLPPCVTSGLPPKVTILGKTDIYNWEKLVGQFLGHKLLGLNPPTPSNTSLGGWGGVIT